LVLRVLWPGHVLRRLLDRLREVPWRESLQRLRRPK
jgi:hypothetical protein